MSEQMKEEQQAQEDMDTSYVIVFSGHHGERVLEDLYRFCGKDSKCVMRDPYDTYLALGMRTPSLYIEERLNGERSTVKQGNKPSNYKQPEGDKDVNKVHN